MVKRSYFGVFTVLAAMALLCVLAGTSAAATGDTTRASVDSSGTQAENGASSSPSISADGRYVAFASGASNLVAGDTNGFGDVFVHELGNATRPSDCVAPTTTVDVTTGGSTNVTVSPSTNGLGATLNPYGTSSTLLASKTRYRAVVTTGARDLAGNVLDQDRSTVGDQQKAWYFTTGRQ